MAALGVLLLPGTAAVSVEGAPKSTTVAAWERVARQVRERLMNDEQLRDVRIAVTASGLVLTLSGRVPSRGLADRAVELARREAAPHMVVVDELTVEQPPVADDLIAQTVAERLVAVDRPAIVVSIDGGLVILTGVAWSQRERQRLVETVQQTAGVTAVIDRIEVRAPPDAGAPEVGNGGR
jgi:osmotically-inducible protein OsmY